MYAMIVTIKSERRLPYFKGPWTGKKNFERFFSQLGEEKELMNTQAAKNLPNTA